MNFLSSYTYIPVYWFYTAFANPFSGNTKEFFNILKNFSVSIQHDMQSLKESCNSPQCFHQVRHLCTYQ